MLSLPFLPEGMLFDLDGTLADTIPQLALAAQNTARTLKIEVPALDVVKSYVGNGVQMLLARVILKRKDITLSDVDPALLGRARSIFNEIYKKGLSENYEIYPHVKETLVLLRDFGVKLAVCTNKPMMFAEPLLRYMDLTDYFDFILGGEVIKERKPDPAPLLHVCKQLKVTASRSVMVGDSDNDILGGKRAGMLTVFIEGGYYFGDIDAIGPDFKIQNYQQLAALVKDANK